MPSLTFLGAAGTVTGSKHLLDTGAAQVLVDAGLFQGLKELRLRNWEDLPLAARHIEAVLLTHAHLDHVGYLPRLVRQGFRGRVFCTGGTKELAKLILLDSAKLQEEDARYANRKGYSRHKPALPLYTTEDALRAIELLQPVGYHRPMPVAPGIEASFVPVGHLLGAAAIEVTLTGSGTRIVFGGDLGRYGRPVLLDPEPIAKADVLLVESTYGGREHAPDDDGEVLARVIRETADRGGRVIIPAFAIGRVEEVLYWIKKLEDEKRVPPLPVFLDSPMALAGLALYADRTHELDPEFHENGGGMDGFTSSLFTAITSTDESKALTLSREPSIIVSSSGMATGGRVLHHLRASLPDERSAVVFVGYQAAGSRGRSLVEGASHVKIHGQLVEVRARVVEIDSMSAHADASEILRWLRGFTAPPEVTYLVHGEPDSQQALRDRITGELGWRVEIPAHGDTVAIPGQPGAMRA
ncbi:MAG TPA: MBL fold metallo-hydrolase [Vicinamibacterales bacterium]